MRRLHCLLPLLFLLPMYTSCEEAEQFVNFLDSISDGSPCTDNIECLGGRCLMPEQGYPNGYCTTLSCEESGCSGLFSECFRTEVSSTEVTACYERCEADGTCPRAAEGYQCVMLSDTPVCLPPMATSAPVLGAVGSSCSSDAQCNGEGAACLQTFFGGYCAILDCASSGACPGEGRCVALNPQGETEAERSNACLASCQADSDCRFGYSCQEYEGERVCLEGEQRARNPEGAEDGEPCVANINCKGNTCVRESEGAGGQRSYPDGMCATRDCDADTDCFGANAVCISRERSTTCRASCQTDADCRDGYTCRDSELGTRYCDSRAQTVVNDADPTGLQVTCVENQKTLTFEIPDGAIGFYIAPYTTQNQRVRPETLRFPDGSTLDLKTDYDFLAVNPEILGSLSPLLFPATDRSPLRTRFVPGTYQMTVETRATSLCSYVLPQMAEGTKLSLNIYMVGVPGLKAEQASRDADIDQMMRTVRKIYTSMGVEVEIARFVDVEPSVADTYRIMRDFNDVFGLVATSQTPPDEQVLSVNVFLIEDFNVSDAPGLLGVSTGIPGMAGLHGTSGSGLVFSTASLGSDNVSLGQTMAHEIGHFLGLRHTTEHFGSAHDPISDTGECALPDLGFFCPDAENFMFAFSLGGDRQINTTPGQSFVVRRNPLVRP